MRIRLWTPWTRAAGVGAVALMAAVAMSAPASAGEDAPPGQASATSECRDMQGFIEVTVVGGSPYTFDIEVGESAPSLGVPQGAYSFGPLTDGLYSVDVTWNPNDGATETAQILNVMVSVECAPSGSDPTTTLAPTTTTDAGAGGAATTVAPTLPASGSTSSNIALVAILMTMFGGGLLFTARHTRRS
jgi:LPXTG-motif cell wall-anchored protein